MLALDGYPRAACQLYTNWHTHTQQSLFDMSGERGARGTMPRDRNLTGKLETLNPEPNTLNAKS
jgi:hypothetical protein